MDGVEEMVDFADQALGNPGFSAGAHASGSSDGDDSADEPSRPAQDLMEVRATTPPTSLLASANHRFMIEYFDFMVHYPLRSDSCVSYNPRVLPGMYPLFFYET
jgi:hypothetical protein